MQRKQKRILMSLREQLDLGMEYKEEDYFITHFRDNIYLVEMSIDGYELFRLIGSTMRIENRMVIENKLGRPLDKINGQYKVPIGRYNNLDEVCRYIYCTTTGANNIPENWRGYERKN